MALSVPIISEFVDKGIKRAIEEFKQLETTGEKAQFALQKAALPAAAALGAVGAFAGSSVKKAMEAQAQQERLAAILYNTGQGAGVATDALIAQANALEKVGVASAGSIIAAQAQLATFDLQAETIGLLTPAIVDYVIAEKGATASTADFISMTNSLASALNGQFGALAKSGFVLDDQTKELIKNGDEMERAAALADVLASTYADFNIIARDTAEGQLVALKNSFDSIQETIGMALLPIVQKSMGFFQGFADVISNNTTAVMIAMGVIGGLSAAILTLNFALKAYKAAQIVATVAATAFKAVMAANPITLVVLAIAALVAGLYLAYQRFEGFRKVVDTVFRFIGQAIQVSLNVVKGYFEFVFGFYKTLFNGIAKLWNNTIGKLSFNIPSWVPVIGGKGFSVPQIPMLAAGGIVTGPTLAMIGEKGPEAVVPLDRMGGMGTTINIYSTLADESLPEKLVQALRTYNRTTGPVRIQVI